MKKIYAIIYLTICLQLLSTKLDSATVKHQLLKMHRSSTAPNKAISKTPPASADSVTDIDGNIYHVVKIGKQHWLKENLKTAHFRNGEAIPELEYNNDWPTTGNPGDRGETGYPAWCYLERIKQNDYAYGKLYNWYAVTDQRNVCPTGWHVPGDEEFQLLSDSLGGDYVSGGHMKATALWGQKDQPYADNASGFMALPSGARYKNGSFDHVGADGAAFWSSTTADGRDISFCRVLYYGGSNLGRHQADRRAGFSVRCIGD